MAGCWEFTVGEQLIHHPYIQTMRGGLREMGLRDPIGNPWMIYLPFGHTSQSLGPATLDSQHPAIPFTTEDTNQKIAFHKVLAENDRTTATT